MFAVDSLIVIGATVLNLGTIKEADGAVERSFWLRNDTHQEVTLIQGYTSCGCTTINFQKDVPIQPGDSTQVTLNFNPRGKGGEFYENGTVVYNLVDSTSSPVQVKRMFTNMALEGTCVTSEETLLKQHPVTLSNGLRVSANRFDIGYVSKGQSRERYVSVLFPDMTKESVKFTFVADEKMPKGLQHITQSEYVTYKGKKQKIELTFDVIIK